MHWLDFLPKSLPRSRNKLCQYLFGLYNGVTLVRLDSWKEVNPSGLKIGPSQATSLGFLVSLEMTAESLQEQHHRDFSVAASRLARNDHWRDQNPFPTCHCEEPARATWQSQNKKRGDCFASLAMTDEEEPFLYMSFRTPAGGEKSLRRLYILFKNLRKGGIHSFPPGLSLARWLNLLHLVN
jgi:hypothetical protein